MLVILIFPMALKGSIRLKMLVGNESDSEIFGRRWIWSLQKSSWKILHIFVFFSTRSVCCMGGDVAGPEGLWVINAEERSQYLVHVAAVSLKQKASWLQEVAVWPRSVSAQLDGEFPEYRQLLCSWCDCYWVTDISLVVLGLKFACSCIVSMRCQHWR